jgi:integral membrane protein
MRKQIRFLRHAAIIEGISFLVLLGVAMPLKYFWGQPLGVRIVGLLHGILFLVFCGALVWVSVGARWPLARASLVFLAALVPFGPWLIDKRLEQYETDSTRPG